MLYNYLNFYILLIQSYIQFCESQRQKIQCYDRDGQSGDSVVAKDYIPNLFYFNMKDRINSCCMTGIWILYDETYYNRNNPGARSWWGWGTNFCSDVDNDFKNRAASLRLTGAPDDWKLDTINFYLQQNFIGDEFYTYGDKV